MAKESQRTIADLVFVGFNKQVAALDRYTGETVWTWKAKQGSGFVALLVDGDRLIASVSGYTYCLDPLFGQEVWNNPLPGMGLGVACVVSVNGASAMSASAAGAAVAQQQAAAAAAAG